VTTARQFGKELAGRIIVVLAVMALLFNPILAQQDQSKLSGPHTIHVATEMVLVDVTVRDHNGNPVRDLRREDFTVTEDNKPQQVLSFEIENTDQPVIPAGEPQQAVVLGTPKPSASASHANAPGPDLGKNRRLMILFFDLTSMEPDDIEHSVAAAEKYVDTQMAPADLVSVVSLGSSLLVNQDFTGDHALLKKAIASLNPTSGQGFEEGSTGTTEDTPDNANAFTPDDTEYNIFNTDRRLEALRSIADSLARVDQKKSLIYFSSGMDRTGIENESELRSAINQAVRANMAIYTMDMRGLQALPPGGEAQNASLRGVSPYSGQSTLNDLASNFTTQETLVALSADTGGRAFLDSNDFNKIFSQVQADTSFYYILGYQSTNSARDGHYRHINVRVNRPGVKIEFRRGYYAPADFKHSTRDDRERQLQEELASDLANTDLPVYLSTGYFRLGDNRFYVPVSVVVPGSAIPFTAAKDQDRATLDVLGAAFDDQHRPFAQIRDTVKLSIPGAQEVRRKNVQYNAALILPPGKYHLKVVVRENESGRLGSFETDLDVPDMKKASLKMSSVILSTQTQAVPKRRTDDPLIENGVELIPNVTHVFSVHQHLYFFYEVYDPTRVSTKSAPSQTGRGVRVISNVLFFRGKVKTYETPLVVADHLNVPDRNAALFRLDVPLDYLQPGFYTCQVNVIDDAGGHFLFPRLALLVRPETAAPATHQ
jgi:VWFA-related protein